MIKVLNPATAHYKLCASRFTVCYLYFHGESITKCSTRPIDLSKELLDESCGLIDPQKLSSETAPCVLGLNNRSENL